MIRLQSMISAIIAINLTTACTIQMAEGDDDDGQVSGNAWTENFGSETDLKIPHEYPQLNRGFAGEATYAVHSHPWALPENVKHWHSASDTGMLCTPPSNACKLNLHDVNSPGGVESAVFTSDMVSLTIDSLEPGIYSATFQTGLSHVEYTMGGSTHNSWETSGGSGTIEVVGNNGKAVWGTFDVVVCYAATPGKNCYRVKDGRFAAAIEGVVSSTSGVDGAGGTLSSTVASTSGAGGASSSAVASTSTSGVGGGAGGASSSAVASTSTGR